LEVIIFVHDLGGNKLKSIDDMGMFWIHFGEMHVRIGCARMY